MTSFFPDVNVWIALSVLGHVHMESAWAWLQGLENGDTLLFSRFTQLGLLRLLTNPAAMGERTRTLQAAWEVYDTWLDDPRVLLHAEPAGVESALRHATAPFASQHASKWIGDCYLLAFAQEAGATLVTFDKALAGAARKRHGGAVIPR